MSTSANRTRGAVPTRLAALLAAASLLAMPSPAHADPAGRIALLTLDEGVPVSEVVQSVSRAGGVVLSTMDLSGSMIVRLPVGVGAPAGAREIPDVAMQVNGTQQFYESLEPTYRQTLRAPEGDDAGKGVTVAVLDTGVAPDAAGLGHVQHVNVTGAPDGDGLGHGTFLASLIGGRGAWPGVAPGADLLDVQVADAEGNTSLSLVLQGLEEVADADVDVLNVSLSTESPLPPEYDPLSRALVRLWEDGVVVVTAAGNDGEMGSVNSPGDVPTLLTVGSLDEHDTASREDDSVAGFSSWWTSWSNTKPDVVAPGVSVIAAMAPDSAAADATSWTTDDGAYMRGSGTSMSAAIVAGAAAVILDENPDLAPNGVKALLAETADDLPGNRDGAGSVDLGAALAAAGSAPADPQPKATPGAPDEADADAWSAFAAAWEEGDFDAVKAAWETMAPQTQRWAARSWSIAVLVESLDLPEETFKARSWAARSWSARSWSARSWSADEWLARSWSARSWAARSWAARSWSARSWSARSWSARSWSARSWAARSWAARSWSARSWSARSWSARSWSSEEWAARSWAARSWSARSWSSEEWAARSWAARSWSARSWSARSWSAEDWEARSWSADLWSTVAWM